MANFTSFLPQAEKWISGLGLHSLYGHPHKASKARHIKIAKAHLRNHLISHGKHPAAMRGASVESALRRADRRSGAYKRFRVGKG